jgi:hypothetical protein
MFKQWCLAKKVSLHFVNNTPHMGKDLPGHCSNETPALYFNLYDEFFSEK